MKNIIIFGAGSFGKHAYNFYQDDININIIAFSDNDITKHNTIFYTKKIINPTEIKQIDYDEIIIASSYSDQIYDQLVNMQISPKKLKIISMNKVASLENNENKLILTYEIMQKLALTFNQNQIEYFLDHGSLLGLIRSNALIPWDIDVDFAIMEDQVDILQKVLDQFLPHFNSKYCLQNNWKYSCHYDNLFLDSKLQKLLSAIQIYNDTQNDDSATFWMDIIIKYKENDNISWAVSGRKLLVPYNVCLPTSSIIFNDYKIKVPANTNKYLELLFGDWKQEVKDWSYDNYSNINKEG